MKSIRICNENKPELVCSYCKRDEKYYKEKYDEILSLFEMFVNSKRINKADIIHSKQAILDIITRIDKRNEYFQYFHRIKTINEFKNTALLIYWINKLHPFMCVESNNLDEDSLNVYANINEKFSIFLLMGIIMKHNPQFLGSSDERPGYLGKFIDEIEYSLRFRDISKESLILLLEPLYLNSLIVNNADC